MTEKQSFIKGHFTTQQEVQQARYRLTPLALDRFTEGVPISEDSQTLSQEEVEERSFAVLGYMEEYFRPLSQAGTEIKVNGEMSLSLGELEAYLDESVLSDGLAQNGGDKVIEEAQTATDHREKIKQKISDLLSHPKVREKFQKELKREVGFYQAARKPMREVRDIDRVTKKLRQTIYRLYLASKKKHGKLVQSASDQIAFFQRKADELESTKKGIESAATAEILGYLETQKLLDYKKQLKEHGFVTTPSREHLIDRITREAVAGKKIFLVGSTGTGKTELAFYVLDSLTGGYEIVPWHEGTTPRDIFGYRELYEDAEGKVQSGVKPGPYPLALQRKVGLLHEEFTGGPTRTQLSMKYLMGKRPGEKVQIQGFNGEVHEITPNFIELFTGNPKDERTKQREDMDPAILRELTGIEVGYMPATEMLDIIRAKLIEENGVLRLAATELKYIEQLCKAAEMMQKIHNRDFEGFTQEMKAILGIDPQGNTETTLNTNFLDPGTLFKLFGEWELARARGQHFADYMQAKLGEFVSDPKTLSTPEERKTLQKVLHSFGLITSAFDDIQVVIGKLEDEKGYILPSEMAGHVSLSNENPMDAISPEARRVASSEFQRSEEKFWRDKLKPASGSVFEIPELPRSISQEALENFAGELEYVAVRSFPMLDIGTLDDLRGMDVDKFLARIEQRYPGLRVYESLSDSEKNDHTVGRLLNKWYWQQVKAGKINFPEIYNKGGWYVMEVMPKPMHRDSYVRTMISDEVNHLNRFNVTWDTAKGDIVRKKFEILTKLGLPTNLEVRMPTAGELNMLLNRMGIGTNTSEWTEDEFRNGIPACVIVGHSDDGGAASATWDHPLASQVRLGFRVVVVLGT